LLSGVNSRDVRACVARIVDDVERFVRGAPQADDLTLIGGIGPKIQDVLNSLGIFHFRQIAGWTPENTAWVDEYLSFSGRITREGWIEQAAVLVNESGEA
jgi:predicted flap endonuclease-1-like 5' DNA nuclease